MREIFSRKSSLVCHIRASEVRSTIGIGGGKRWEKKDEEKAAQRHSLSELVSKSVRVRFKGWP